jgi:glucose/arabinose dehydrogenase
MRRFAPLALVSLLAGCPDSTLQVADGGIDGPIDGPADAPVDAPHDAPVDVPPDASLPDGSILHPCDLPGSIQYTTGGVVVVPGGPTKPDLKFLKVPTGFCVHYYGNVGNARQLRFAPGGELFVASPTMLTTGGGSGGQNAIVILPDDNHDGLADLPITFLSNLPSTQGLLFTADHFYYQDGTKIMRMPYKVGDRKPNAPVEQLANVTYYSSGLHWPKPIDIADDGTIYFGNGGDQGEACVAPHPFHGGVLKLDGTDNGAQVSKGYRNPIAVRCARGKNQCFAIELAKDYTATANGREKLVPIRQGDDWGFPCCASKNVPYGDIQPPPTSCGSVAAEDNGFYIGDTPFGLAFEPGTWPAPWTGSAFVATHGAAGSWTGARLIAIAMDPTTGLPKPSSNANANGTNTGAMTDFAVGWDDATLTHGRPAAVEFSPDGRLFIANDNNGEIVWIAPL